MKKNLYSAVFQLYCLALMVINRLDVLSYHASTLIFSIMPLLPVWGSIWLFHLSFQDAKQNGLRFISYDISVFWCIVCLLSFLGVLSFTRVDDKIISPTHYRCLMVFFYSTFVSTLVNMGFLIRDSYVSDREKGLL